MNYRNIFPVLALIICTLSCGKDDTDSTSIAMQRLKGEWLRVNTWDDGYVAHGEYKFSDDLTVEITGRIYDPKTNEFKGYLSRQTGTYSIKGDSVILTQVKQYVSNSILSMRFEDLEFSRTLPRQALKITFNTLQTELTISYPRCHPWEDCPGSFTYSRQATTAINRNASLAK
jgi:hypothetical protein